MTSLLLRLYILCLVVVGVTSYPVDKINNGQDELKDETRYSNGTVVGKYTYADNEGNPIHVKYYADDKSYGVELESIRVVKTTTEGSSWEPNHYFDTYQPAKSPLGMTSELDSSSAEANPKKADIENKKKVNPNKNTKTSDYETFYQNDIKAPRTCESGKVSVYLDKEKKIIKRALDRYQATKYCDRL